MFLLQNLSKLWKNVENPYQIFFWQRHHWFFILQKIFQNSLEDFSQAFYNGNVYFYATLGKSKKFSSPSGNVIDWGIFEVGRPQINENDLTDALNHFPWYVLLIAIAFASTQQWVRWGLCAECFWWSVVFTSKSDQYACWITSWCQHQNGVKIPLTTETMQHDSILQALQSSLRIISIHGPLAVEVPVARNGINIFL